MAGRQRSLGDSVGNNLDPRGVKVPESGFNVEEHDDGAVISVHARRDGLWKMSLLFSPLEVAGLSIAAAVTAMVYDFGCRSLIFGSLMMVVGIVLATRIIKQHLSVLEMSKEVTFEFSSGRLGVGGKSYDHDQIKSWRLGILLLPVKTKYELVNAIYALGNRIMIERGWRIVMDYGDEEVVLVRNIQRQTGEALLAHIEACRRRYWPPSSNLEGAGA